MNQKIKVILFDVGNVLIKVHPEKTSEFLLNNSKSNDHSVFAKKLSQSKIYHDFEMNHISEEDFIEHVKNEYKLEHLSKSELIQAWNLCLGDPLDFIEDHIHTLSQNFLLYGLSNTNKTHYDYFMKKYPLFNKFETVFTSVKFNLRKPDPLIYKKTFESISKNVKINPQEILFIDDLSENIISASKFGFTSELMLTNYNYLEEILKKHAIIK